MFGWLKAAVAEGTLARFSRGVYYVPERAEVLGRAVEAPLDPEKVIARKYLVAGGEAAGFVSGLALQNHSRVSNQVPAVLEVTTNAETNRSRRIRPFGGYREIVLKKPRVLSKCNAYDSKRSVFTSLDEHLASESITASRIAFLNINSACIIRSSIFLLFKLTKNAETRKTPIVLANK
ncbi:hypothetical protein [Adlercreutzia sp. ZJ242]|uniref:hypothetical protein n=1 Tax=Adlercreutzia sp. ZJ242 TaxID=2709409 RepID=UPI0013EAA721|nr:hypothetical protein [Adlercreutzia sp. ZJ242]